MSDDKKALKVILKIAEPGADAREVAFEDDKLIAGSGDSADLKLEDEAVSPVHVMFKRDGAKVLVLGLGSEAHLNGDQLLGEESVDDGGEVKLGETTITVSFTEASDEDADSDRDVTEKKAAAEDDDEREVTEKKEAPADDAADEADEKAAEADGADEKVEAKKEAKSEKKADKKKGKKSKKAAKPEKKADEKAEEEDKADAEAEDKADDADEKVEERAAEEKVEAKAEKSEKKAAKPEKKADKKDSDDAWVRPDPILTARLPKRDRPSGKKRQLEVSLLYEGTLLEIEHFDKPTNVTVGEDKSHNFHISMDELGVDHFTLVQAQGGDVVVVVPDAADVKVTRGKEVLDRAALEKAGDLKPTDGKVKSKALTLSNEDYVEVNLLHVEFIVRYVAPARIVPAPFLKHLDMYYLKVLALSVLGHALLLFALYLTPQDLEDLEEDLFANPNRFAKMILEEEQKKKKKKFDLSGKKSGAKAKKKEGKFGRKDKPPKDAVASVKGAPKVDPNKREKDRKIALSSGLLGMLNKGKGNTSNVFGPGGLGTGINNALGGLSGSDMGDAGGVGGLGSRGTGPGGGGSALGIGGLGGYGRGRGGGGMGNIDLGGKGKSMTRVIPGKTIIKGGLSKDIIGRIIRRHWAQVKFCYERELNKNPNLYGKIVVFFVIGGTGAVQSARVRQTSMNSANVENCIVRVMKRLRFPKVPGGGTVDVSYPFIFQAK